MSKKGGEREITLVHDRMTRRGERVRPRERVEREDFGVGEEEQTKKKKTKLGLKLTHQNDVVSTIKRNNPNTLKQHAIRLKWAQHTHTNNRSHARTTIFSNDWLFSLRMNDTSFTAHERQCTQYPDDTPFEPNAKQHCV